jgi:hypothetical protein
VTIGNGVISIGDQAFEVCTNLASVTFGSNVTSIGANAFYECSNLTSVTIPNSVTSIGAYAFASTGLINVTIPGNVTSIGEGVFSNSELTSVTIPKSVTSIGEYAFNGCSVLSSVTIPGSVTSIEDYAFDFCTSLNSVYFTNNAPSADYKVFISDNNATVYYLLSTSGWGSTFAGLPTVGISNSKFSWRQNNFSTTQLGNPSVVGDTAEPAGDGIPNLLKYAFNLPALVSGQASLPQPIASSGNLVLTFQAQQADLTYTVEACTDLANWSTTGVTTQTNGTQITASYPIPANGSAFLRVVVAPAP